MSQGDTQQFAGQGSRKSASLSPSQVVDSLCSHPTVWLVVRLPCPMNCPRGGSHREKKTLTCFTEFMGFLRAKKRDTYRTRNFRYKESRQSPFFETGKVVALHASKKANLNGGLAALHFETLHFT
jgi:hypothetical protein